MEMIVGPVGLQRITAFLAPAHLDAFFAGFISGAILVLAIYYQAGVRWVRTKDV